MGKSREGLLYFKQKSIRNPWNMGAREGRCASKVSTWGVTLRGRREVGGRPLAWKGAPVVTLGDDPTAGPAR